MKYEVVSTTAPHNNTIAVSGYLSVDEVLDFLNSLTLPSFVVFDSGGRVMKNPYTR